MSLGWERDQSGDLHARFAGGQAVVSWQEPEKSGYGYYYRVDWNDGRSTVGEAADENEAMRICERLNVERR